MRCRASHLPLRLRVLIGLAVAPTAGVAIGAAPLVPVGPEIVVDETVGLDQAYPRTEVLPGGAYLVVWDRGREWFRGTEDGSSSIQARAFDEDLEPLGTPFQVNSYATGRQRDAHTASQPDGSFVVVWTSDGSTGTDVYSSVLARRFAAPGVPIGLDFQVNAYTRGYQGNAQLTAETSGQYVVAWLSSPGGGEAAELRGRRLDPSGELVGAELPIHASPDGWPTPSDLVAAPAAV